MSDTLVVAISQSGTTTDTNRTVDLGAGPRRGGRGDRQPAQQRPRRQVRRRALHVRRARRRDGGAVHQGVLRADRGRVPARARHRRRGRRRSTPSAVHELLDALRALPDAMDAGARRSATPSPRSPRRHAASAPLLGGRRQRPQPHRRRTRCGSRLSELCYKSIACDATEDKKHIDLSAEPLILVCAAGLQGSNADDVAKEIAIYRAHRAAPIVIANEGERPVRRCARDHPGARRCTPTSAFVLSAMAGHLFGYEAALAIDASARPLREARAAIQAAVSATRRRPTTSSPGCDPPSRARRPAFLDGLRAGGYDGHLEAGTAVRIASLLRYATGIVPLDVYQVEHGKVGTPSRRGRGPHRRAHRRHRGADPAGRRDQAPGQDGHRRHLPLRRGAAPGRRWSREVLAAGAARDALSYRALRTLVALDPRSSEVVGFTRYRIEGDVDADDATIHVVDRGGISRRPAARAPTTTPGSWVPSTASPPSARSPSPAAAATGAP